MESNPPQIDSAIDLLIQRSSTAPDALAIFADVTLVWVTLDRVHTLRGGIALVGYLLLLVSRYLKRQRGAKDPVATRTAKAGYAVLLFSLSYTHVWDAAAVVGYLMAIAGNPQAAAPMSLYNALGVGTATGWPMVAARAALVLYLT